MQFLFIGDLLVNLANVVAFDIDNQNNNLMLVRIWYTGSATPVPIQPPGIAAGPFIQLLRNRGLLT